MSLARGPWIADVSPLVRMGLKGPRAAQWLTQAGIDVPPRPNSWLPLNPTESPWSVIARLGSTEFFLEEESITSRINALTDALAVGASHVYPVPRQDRAFVLGGQGVEDVLAQVCNVDFAGLDLASNPAVLTLMIGVAVLIVPQQQETERRYRIWCDPTFGEYLYRTLETIVDENKTRKPQ
jgi:sarcosine oxidase, subunit gamma